MLKTLHEIKIFVVHDHNITKTNTHAPDAHHHKELTKTAQKGIQKHPFDVCPRLKNLAKNNKESRFSCCMIKQCTHLPNANPLKLVQTNIEKWSQQRADAKC